MDTYYNQIIYKLNSASSLIEDAQSLLLDSCLVEDEGITPEINTLLFSLNTNLQVILALIKDSHTVVYH